MSLNLTPEDLKLGQYEAQKRVLLKRFVQKRAIINDPEDGRFPARFVRSELLDFMVEACDKTGVCVVRAERGMGKSTAAKFVLKNSAGGIMFCNCRDPILGCYMKGVADALGIPKNVYESSDSWHTLLVKAVSGVSSQGDQANSSWREIFVEKFLTMCSNVEAVEDEVVPTVDGLDLTTVKTTPIIVFDDFNNVTEEDILFLDHLFPIVEANDVLLFVMVRDKATADRLVGLNGWGRIFPLEQICDDVSTPQDREKIAEWRPIHWGRDQLEEIVRSRFGTIPGMREIEDGENPLDLIKEARRMVRRQNYAPDLL